MSTPKIGILVAGMHRSGTSAVARLLNILGAAVPDNLMAPHAEINAKGFWESIDVSALNDELLNNHRSRWDDVLTIPLDNESLDSWQDFETKATKLLERDFSKSSMFVLKDPRICRLLPYWIRLFECNSIEPRIVIPIRHPLEVAASLNRRDGFPEEKSLYLWLRHIVDAERATRNIPRSFLLYDELLADWRSSVGRIATELGIKWLLPPETVANEADDFLDAQLRHHRFKPDLFDERDPIAKWTSQLFLALQQGNTNIPVLIDRIHTDLLTAEQRLAPIIQDVSRQLTKSELALHDTRVWGSELDAQIKETQHELNRSNQLFEEKCRHVNLLLDETIHLKHALSDAQQSLDMRTNQLTDAEEVITTLLIETRNWEMASNATLESKLQELAIITQSNEEKILQLEKFRQSISLASSNIQGKQHLLKHAANRLEEMDSTIHHLYAAHSHSRFHFWKANKNRILLNNTPLFDSAFYLSAHSEVLSSGMTPQEHYLKIGAQKGWDPHPLFSTSWYLEKNRDVTQCGANPLIHFLKHGAKEKRSPHPLFDISLYLAAYPQASATGMNPLEHYVSVGGLAGWRPHWLFDGKAYLDTHPEVREQGINPLSHYLQFGHLKGYRPHWAFDAEYYLDQNPVVPESGVPALLHFVTKGASLRLNPSAQFDTSAYLRQYPFLESCNENPLEYYVQGFDREAVFNPSAISPPIASIEEPATPIHNEEPGRPLPAFMDFLHDEFGEVLRTEIIQRMQRFHLPFTSEKIAPKLTDEEIGAWIDEIAFMSNARPDIDQPDVSIVIPVFNQLAFTLACIHSVLSAKTKFSYEIIVADDRSTDRTTEIFSHNAGRIRHVLGAQNQGFIRNCNNAAQHVRGRYLVLLNNDTIVLPGWLDELIGTLEANPDIGLVGSKLLYPDGRLQEAGGIIFDDGSGWNYGRMDEPRKPQYCYMRDADYVSGASIALSTEFWRSVGGFDERYSVAYYEDTDMAFRVRQAGLRVAVQPLSQLLHFEGVSSGTDTSSGAKQYQLTNAVVFRDKWKHVLQGHGQCDPQRLPADRTRIGNILVIDACTPTPDRDAGSLETFHHLRILKSFGLNVIFAPENLAYFGRYTQDLQRMGIETLYAPFWMSFESVLKTLGGSFELVMIYRAPVANRLIDMVRLHAPRAKIIFDTIDLHFLREEREAALHSDPEKVKAAATTRRKELNIISHADATIILSSHEMNVVQELLPKAKLYEIPIVCNVPGKGPLNHAQRKDIVFIGGFRHAPNLDAVKWFVSDVWPHLLAKGFTGNFHIVGADMPNEITRMHGDGIIVRGHVPDIADVFNEVRVSVAPLRFGAGLKGKVITSLSFGVPVVATSVAVEGGGFTHEDNVLVADDPEEFADAIIRLYGDQGMWENLSHSGVKHCEQTFSVSVVSNKLRKLICDIAPHIDYAKSK